MNDFVIGIDVGGTNTPVGLIDSARRIVASESFPTSPDPESGIREMIRVVECLLKGAERVVGIGIGVPGRVRDGQAWCKPNLPRWLGVPFVDELSNRFSLRVVLDNDANVAALGEAAAGAGKGFDRIALLTLGTGIGGGTVVAGKVMHGSTGLASEFGHIIVQPEGPCCNCGQRGCLEALASATVVAARAQKRMKKKLTCAEVFQQAAAGDQSAIKLVDETAYWLAMGCVSISHFMDPDVLLLAGGMTAAGPWFLQTVQSHFDRLYWTQFPEKPKLLYAALGNKAGLIGAGELVRQTVE